MERARDRGALWLVHVACFLNKNQGLIQLQFELLLFIRGNHVPRSEEGDFNDFALLFKVYKQRVEILQFLHLALLDAHLFRLVCLEHK